MYHLANSNQNKAGVAMAPHSSTAARKISWMEEPGRQSMESLRVRHDWVSSLSLSTFMHWRRKWQPTPVFLPGESQGQESMVGWRLWGHTESDTTEVTSQHHEVAVNLLIRQHLLQSWLRFKNPLAKWLPHVTVIKRTQFFAGFWLKAFISDQVRPS